MNPQYTSDIRTLLKLIGAALATHGATKAAALVNSEDCVGLVLVVAGWLWSRYSNSVKGILAKADKIAGSDPAGAGSGAGPTVVGLFLLLSLVLAGCMTITGDALVVNTERSETIAKAGFDAILQTDNASRDFYRTNAPGFHQFCEWLRQPQSVPGLASPLPRDYALLRNLDQVKLAYISAKTAGNSNAVIEVLATVTSAADQASAWMATVKK